MGYEAVKAGIENTFSHSASIAIEAISILRTAYDRPSAVYRPTLTLDGNKWIALYGPDLQVGCVGVGNSPDEAMWDFDRAWHKKTGTTT